jgi:hypothetical protein
MKNKQIILYGIGGPEVQYCAIRYWVIDSQDLSVKELKGCAMRMRIEYPSIKRVFAVDNRYGLRKDYIESIKDRYNSMESRLAFLDMIEREGIEIV